MTPGCVHDISKGHNSIEALESTNWRLFETNPHLKGMKHSITMAFTMDQIREYILEPHERLPQKKTTAMPEICRFSGAYVTSMRSRINIFDRGDVSMTVAYIWQYCRSGIFVSVRNSQLKLFVPFCNKDYRNTWSPQVRKSLPRASLPGDRWWCNGWMLCEMQPADIWGDTWLCALRNMLESSCSTGRMGDCDFIINKRDTPCVRHDGKDPMNPFDALPRIINPSALIPVLSFNGGREYADICCPLAVDWCRATGKVYAQKKNMEAYKPPADVYWEHKDQIAVWRGSMTGTGIDSTTNQRAYLCSLRSPLLDCKLTGSNSRWKLCPRTKRIERAAQNCNLRDNFMSVGDQQHNFRYGICVDGHGAADRTGELLNGRQCILKVKSPPCTLGHSLWLDDLFFPWEHYVPVSHNLNDLVDSIQWLIDDDTRAMAIAKNCASAHKQYLCVSGITEWWIIVSNLMK
tara:strand:- start:48419 stop:49801 length:1383 start_codon:yes stop_codon:yes gene_type:complete